MNARLASIHPTASKINSRNFPCELFSEVRLDRERVGRPVVDSFETAVERANKDKGYIVAFSFTRDARQEAKRVKRAKGLEIKLVEVADLLEKPAAVIHPLPGQAIEEQPELISTEPYLEGPPKDALPSSNKLIQSARKSGKVA